jgi:hypothetical protein
MPNPIKYSTGSETLALKKGDFYIGTGDVGKGPTSTTGYYNGITPPSGGYTIYLNKASGGPSIYAPSNDAQLISLTNSIAGASYTTANECLVYFAGQTDKVVFNRDYEPIVTDGLVLNLDAGFTPSYPRSGTTWYDISGNGYNGSLVNGPTYTSTNGGGIQGDGTNDNIQIANVPSLQPADSFSVFALFNITSIAFVAGTTDNCGTVFGRSSSLLGNFGIGCFYDDITSNSTISIGLRNTSNQFISSSVSYTFGTTIYVGFTYTPGQGKFYSNGDLLGTNNNAAFTSGSLLTTNFQSFTANAIVGGNGRRLGGIMYISSVYNKALSDVEVQQNFNALKARYGL